VEAQEPNEREWHGLPHTAADSMVNPVRLGRSALANKNAHGSASQLAFPRR
jgi:hypothetical protein